MAGQVSVKITRTDRVVGVSWDWQQLWTGQMDTPLAGVLLDFMYYPYPSSFFGTETVDLLQVIG